MNLTNRKIRIAVIGCGAIAHSHAQAIRATEDVDCTILFDSDTKRAEAFRRDYFPGAEIAERLERVADFADAAIVAVPNAYHAPISIGLLRAGLHVLCQKPLATTLAAAREMATTAAAGGLVLACVPSRLFADATELVRQTLSQRIVGMPRRVEVRESVWDWPLNRASFDSSIAGGGILIDMGPHCLAQLSEWLGTIEVVEYRDDNDGGLEATAFARVLCRSTHRNIEGEIFLTRAQRTRCYARIECDDGSIEVDPHVPSEIKIVHRRDGNRFDTIARTPPSDPFFRQLENFVAAIRGEKAPALSTDTAVAHVGLIESCYRTRRKLDEPWIGDPGQVTIKESSAPYQKILVTGSAGQIGSRLVEMWAARDQLQQVRCMVRSYRAAARLMRFPVETVEADLLDLEAVRRAASGCDAIIHLGLGERAERETISLLKVARALGIRRFVHMSTAAVYGIRIPQQIGEQQEESKTAKLGEPYADQKVGAERAVLRECARGLEGIVLRPHIVYGPYMRWSSELFELLAVSRLPIIEDGGYCNLIYVDDLIEAVMRGLTAKEGFGQPMFITDGAPITWREYIEAHAALSRTDPPRIRRAEVQRPKLSAREWLKASVRPLGPVMRSNEFRAFVFESPAVQATLFRAYLALRDKPLLSPLVANLRRSQTMTPATNGDTSYHELWTSLQLSEGRLSAARAETLLGFRARTAFAEGLRRVALWAEHYGLITEAKTPAHSRVRGAEPTLVES